MALKPSLENGSHLPTAGGYDDGIFVNPPGEDLGVHCPVCLLVLREPHLLACCGGHLCEVKPAMINSRNNYEHSAVILLASSTDLYEKDQECWQCLSLL